MEHIPIETAGRKGFASDIKRDYKAQAKLEKIINGKQTVEWKMAKNLLAEFNDRRTLLHGGLKGLVFNAMEDIEDIWIAKGDAAIRMAYYKDAVNYKFVKSKEGVKIFTSAEEFFKKVKDRLYLGSLNASELGNLIRFYGEVIEAGRHLSNEPAPKWLKKPKWDKDPGGNVEIPKQNWGTPKNDLNAQAYDDKKHLPTFFKGHDDKMKSYQRFGGKDPLHKDEKFWDKSEEGHRRRKAVRDLKPQDLQLYRQKQSQVERALVAAGGGISLFVQLPQDLLNKIDLVFGLSHGATISGTTTDTIYSINRMFLLDRYLCVGKPNIPKPLWMQAHFEGWDWRLYQETGKKYVATRVGDKVDTKRPYICRSYKDQYSSQGFKGIDPVYYMLPFGTIVGEAHHTTTEVALPLSLNLNYDANGNELSNKIFNYSIGMYRKLMPERGEARKKNAPGLGVAKINTILSAAEKDPKNVLILVYYTESMGRTGGYLRFNQDDTDDMKIWEEVAKTGPQMMRNFKVFKPHPTRKDLASLHPAIRRKLGETGETRKFVNTGARNKFDKMKEVFIK